MQCFSDEILLAYLNEELEESMDEYMRQHLAVCHECPRRIQELRCAFEILARFFAKQFVAQKPYAQSAEKIAS